MYNQTLYNGLINIIPFWSSNIIQILGLGNEYNIVLNIIFNELLKITTTTFNDTILMSISTFIIIILIGYKYGFTLQINLFEKNIIKIKGKELKNIHGTSLNYCDKILSINNYLVNIKKFKNITYIDDINIIINEINYYELTPKIYLDVKRVITDDKFNCEVIYTLTSYSCDIEKFIHEICSTYKNLNSSEITLIGHEHDNTILYPEPIHAINYYVNKNFKFPKLKCMITTETQKIEEKNNAKNNDDNNDVKNIKNKSKTNNYSYTLDNIINFNMGKVFLSINRNNCQVTYNIRSSQIECKEWLYEIINDYNQNKNSDFKNKLVLKGREVIQIDSSSFKSYYYSKDMWCINWLLIEKLNYQHFECVNGQEKTLMYKYVLEPLKLYKIQDDLFLTVEKENRLRWFETTKKNEHNNDMDIIYTLHSNTLNIKKILENYVKSFEIYKNEISQNKILYHFTYSGMENNDLIFNSKILSETNSESELFETFDNIYNEHTETFKKDIDKLKNLEYYKSHGLKRKKGYLFHGIPGCGKTSSVVAMALYDSRHIIEIPFSLITTHQEFEKIMNLKSINNIEINNNNIILLFDEIDIGMEKISSRINNESQTDDNQIKTVIKALIPQTSDLPKKISDHKINLGTLLTKLDGIGNYNGLIIIGTTNYINKLDPAIYRELRLTPIEFKQLRKEDSIRLIQSYFGSNYDPSFNDIIKDRYLTPTKLISLCQKYENETIEYFFNNVLNNI